VGAAPDDGVGGVAAALPTSVPSAGAEDAGGGALLSALLPKLPKLKPSAGAAAEAWAVLPAPALAANPGTPMASVVGFAVVAPKPPKRLPPEEPAMASLITQS
jgi:hypothetical protein